MCATSAISFIKTRSILTLHDLTVDQLRCDTNHLNIPDFPNPDS